MASIINTSTTLGGIATEGDSSNELKIQTDGTDAISIDGSQVVTFAAPIVFPAGTASAPAITTTGDTNTGIYFPGADRIGFAEGGAQCGEFDASGNFQFNSGYGSVATAYGCRAWVNFNGTGTVAIRASGNVTSITDNGTGDYTVNFTTAMPDANYSTVGSCIFGGGSTGSVVTPASAGTPTTSAVRFSVRSSVTANVQDYEGVNVAIFR